MKGVFRVKEQKKISLESLVSEIEKNGRIGRLGKVFKTEKNYYFYDTGTGKVAKLNGSITNFVGFPIPLVALSAHIE